MKEHEVWGIGGLLDLWRLRNLGIETETRDLEDWWRLDLKASTVPELVPDHLVYCNFHAAKYSPSKK